MIENNIHNKYYEDIKKTLSAANKFCIFNKIFVLIAYLIKYLY